MKIEELKLFPKLEVLYGGVPCIIEGYDFAENKVIVERIDVDIANIKPILRPLSHLDKEDTYDGETRRAIDIINDLDEDFMMIVFDHFDTNAIATLKSININLLKHQVVMWLTENNFDVFGWIEKDLAISFEKRWDYV